jgi:hypothetical protein
LFRRVYKCKKDPRRTDNGPIADTGPIFQGSAKDTAARDACAKSVATDVMNALIDGIEDRGLDVPDSFVFTRLDKTASGFTVVVNDATVPVTVGTGCSVKNLDISSVVGSVGE